MRYIQITDQTMWPPLTVVRIVFASSHEGLEHDEIDPQIAREKRPTKLKADGRRWNLSWDKPEFCVQNVSFFNHQVVRVLPYSVMGGSTW